jgi:hypothetical protein
MTVNLPPAPAPEPVPVPTPEELGYRPLRDLVGQTINVDAVEDLDGIPIVVVADRRYICSGTWAEEGGTVLGAHLNRDGVDHLTVKVVELNGMVGFTNPDV